MSAAQIQRRQGAARLARVALLWGLAACCLARPMPQLAQPDYTIYHTKDAIFREVKAIVASCPQIMQLSEETLSSGNYTVPFSVVTVEPAGLGGAPVDGKLRLLWNFGEHGRELVSSEIGLHLLRLLCDAPARAAMLDAWGLPRDAVEAVLQRSAIKLVPMENVRGRERVEAGELCLRKNGRGVDPNRNWGVDWGVKEKDYNPDEEYPGTAPFSEPEAELMQKLARAFRPHVWTSVHSGMEALFMPYDHRDTIPEGEGPAYVLEMLKQLNSRTCANKCAVGSGGKSVGYLAHGTATDHMFQELGVPVSLTWEVYGDQKAAFEDCFRMFNPLTAAALNQTVQSWTAAFFTMLSLLPGHPQVAAEVPGLPLPAGMPAAVPAGGGGAQQQQQQPAAQQQQQQQPAGHPAVQQGAQEQDEVHLRNGSSVDVYGSAQQQMSELDSGGGAGVQQPDAAAGLSSLRTGLFAVRRPARSRSSEALFMLAFASAGVLLGALLWRKQPRVRYVLSKLLGSSLSRRRRTGLIPL